MRDLLCREDGTFCDPALRPDRVGRNASGVTVPSAADHQPGEKAADKKLPLCERRKAAS